jgi:hypothetical protein
VRLPNDLLVRASRFLSRPNPGDFKDTLAASRLPPLDLDALEARQRAHGHAPDDVVPVLQKKLRERAAMSAGELLRLLVQMRRGTAAEAGRDDVVERLLRQFEIRRELRLETEKGAAASLALAAFACIMNEAFSTKASWRYFNAALKANDALWRALFRNGRASGGDLELARALALESFRAQESQLEALS